MRVDKEIAAHRSRDVRPADATIGILLSARSAGRSVSMRDHSRVLLMGGTRILRSWGRVVDACALSVGWINLLVIRDCFAENDC